MNFQTLGMESTAASVTEASQLQDSSAMALDILLSAARL
jgi:hypothetical protein